jgi:hypothetical protein
VSDRTERLLELARADALRDVVPPGVEQVRRTVRRRRRAVVLTAAVGVAAAAAAGTLVMGQGGGSMPAGGNDGEPGAQAGAAASGAGTDPSLPVIPQPDPTQLARMEVASRALGDPDRTPWAMATADVVSSDYENHVNDIPEGDYRLSIFCVGEGSVHVVVKAENAGDKVLATGNAPCAETPTATTLKVRQPISGYLRFYLTGDARANAGAAFSFKFVNTKS